jgi:RNA polymerase sigma factor (sigma-70 family)
MKKESDAIVRRILVGESRAEEDLASYLLATIPQWLHISFSRLNPDDVEELASLLTIQILAKIPKFSGKSSFDTWAKRVVRNRVLDWFEKEGRRRKNEISLDVHAGEEGLAPEDILPSPLRSPRQEVDRILAREIAIQCVEKVRNPRQKLILQEHFVSGLSVAEIASRWGVKNRAKLDVLLWQAMESFMKIVKDLRKQGRLDICGARVLKNQGRR